MAAWGGLADHRPDADSDLYKPNPTRSTPQQVLAMEYCPGIKVSDIEKIEAAGIDRKLLAQRSAESYLYQLCRCVLVFVC